MCTLRIVDKKVGIRHVGFWLGELLLQLSDALLFAADVLGRVVYCLVDAVEQRVDTLWGLCMTYEN